MVQLTVEQTGKENMTYEEAVSFRKEAEKKGSVLGLLNMERLMAELSNVQNRLKAVHIAGTNGKGSTLAYLQQILMEAGYQVGRYTSPAVFDDREVITVNGQMISRPDYGAVMTRIRDGVQRMRDKGMEEPTSFEILTALAYCYFDEKKCDIVLIETGMGGDTDATNVIENTLVSILAPVSMDHMQFLGNTLTEIAAHKAGIIKKNSTVICGANEDEVVEVIRKKAADTGALLVIAGKPENVVLEENQTTFSYRYHDRDESHNYTTLMRGAFQPDNACMAVEAAVALRKRGFRISDEAIREGIAHAVWHGRFEKIAENPDIYFDGGHNPGAARMLRKSIEIYFTNRKIIYIIGVLADKDYDQVLQLTASYASAIITVTPQNQRALGADRLSECARKYHSDVETADSVREAVQRAKVLAGTQGVVFVFGSLSYLKEVRDCLEENSVQS